MANINHFNTYPTTVKVKNKNTDFSQYSSYSDLPASERALIYAITWCSSEKSNKLNYTVDDIVSIAQTFKKIIE